MQSSLRFEFLHIHKSVCVNSLMFFAKKLHLTQPPKGFLNFFKNPPRRKNTSRASGLLFSRLKVEVSPNKDPGKWSRNNARHQSLRILSSTLDGWMMGVTFVKILGLQGPLSSPLRSIIHTTNICVFSNILTSFDDTFHNYSVLCKQI